MTILEGGDAACNPYDEEDDNLGMGTALLHRPLLNKQHTATMQMSMSMSFVFFHHMARLS